MVLKDIRSVEWFSLIADEAADVSNREQLVVCIRWVDSNFDIHEDPVELINVPRTDSQTLASAVWFYFVCLFLSAKVRRTTERAI